MDVLSSGSGSGEGFEPGSGEGFEPGSGEGFEPEPGSKPSLTNQLHESFTASANEEMLEEEEQVISCSATGGAHQFKQLQSS